MTDTHSHSAYRRVVGTTKAWVCFAHIDDTVSCMVWSMVLVLYPSSAYERVSEYTVRQLGRAQSRVCEDRGNHGKVLLGNISMEGLVSTLSAQYCNWLPVLRPLVHTRRGEAIGLSCPYLRVTLL